VTPCSVVIGC